MSIVDDSLAEAIRGFLLAKHLPFSELDTWADELIAIVHENGLTSTESPTTTQGESNANNHRFSGPGEHTEAAGRDDPRLGGSRVR